MASGIGSESERRERSLSLLERVADLEGHARVRALEELLHEGGVQLRGRVLALAALLLGDEELVAFLREEADDVVRNAGLEILRLRGRCGLDLAIALLEDPDTDVVLQAVLALEALGDAGVVDPLRGLLGHRDPNVVQAAITALGRLGVRRVARDLVACLDREAWSAMAAIQALGELGAEHALPALKPFLDDPVLGPLAAEAMARIGGKQAIAALSARWLERHGEPGHGTDLRLLAQALAGAAVAAGVPANLRQALLETMRDDAELAGDAARCLLAIGPGDGERAALATLAAVWEPGNTLPECLSNRPDLVAVLLAQEGPARLWGIWLAARCSATLTAHDVARIVENHDDGRGLGALVTLMRRKRCDLLGRPALKLYLRLSLEDRAKVLPLLEELGARDAISAHNGIGKVDRLVLETVLRACCDEALLERWAALDGEARRRALPEIARRPDLLAQLPWSQWFDEEPAPTADLLATLVLDKRVNELHEVVLACLARRPQAALLRAVGQLGLRAAVPVLIGHLEHAVLFPRSLMLDCLGDIGGSDARRALRRVGDAAEGEEQIVALSALARCASGQDVERFLPLAVHQDWRVRAAAADVLGRYGGGEHRGLVIRLAADRHDEVARRAHRHLEQSPC